MGAPPPLSDPVLPGLPASSWVLLFFWKGGYIPTLRSGRTVDKNRVPGYPGFSPLQATGPEGPFLTVTNMSSTRTSIAAISVADMIACFFTRAGSKTFSAFMSTTSPV